MQAELREAKEQAKDLQAYADEKEGLLREKITKYDELKLSFEEILTEAKQLEDDNVELVERNELLEQQKIELEQKLAVEIEVNCQFEEEPDSMVDEDEIEQSSAKMSNNLNDALKDDNRSQATFSDNAIM